VRLVEHPTLIEELSRQSMEYIRRHHSHIAVATQYVNAWNNRNINI
jgi:hypothetical protein